MSSTDSSEQKGCSLCSKVGGHGDTLLQCLTCLREGEHTELAFCTGDCFQRHWRLHRDRRAGLGTPRQESMEAKSQTSYSAPTLRATSQPFTPSGADRLVQHQLLNRGQPSPRVLHYPAMPAPSLAYLAQGGQHPILATGPAYLRGR